MTNQIAFKKSSPVLLVVSCLLPERTEAKRELSLEVRLDISAFDLEDISLAIVTRKSTEKSGRSE